MLWIGSHMNCRSKVCNRIKHWLRQFLPHHLSQPHPHPNLLHAQFHTTLPHLSQPASPALLPFLPSASLLQLSSSPPWSTSSQTNPPQYKPSAVDATSPLSVSFPLDRGLDDGGAEPTSTSDGICTATPWAPPDHPSVRESQSIPWDITPPTVAWVTVTSEPSESMIVDPTGATAIL